MKLPLGYRYASTYAGIRKENRDDLALIVSGIPAAAAGVFTQNRVQAAPVKICRQHLRSSRGYAGAILINAGNANCATRTGERVAVAACRATAKRLKLGVAQVLPASTGVIGIELDQHLIVNAMPELVAGLKQDRFDDVARAIMTTDTRPKTAFAEVPLRRGTARIAGMTKGAGMIHPQMATTLGFVVTDAQIPPSKLKQMLARAVERSYNRLSIDGDTSTNDTVLLLANGACGIQPDPNEMKSFEQALVLLMQDLARLIARDGEGASRFVTIEISGARNEAAAARVARSIANSPLVKTAIAGADPNWGRILCAAGNAGVNFDASKVDIEIQNVLVCRSGVAAGFDENVLKEKLEQPECSIRVHFGGGRASVTFWTCDFTERYVQINASYRT